MREFINKITTTEKIDGIVTLALEHRIKSRLKTQLDSGEEVGIFMQRGNILEDGDYIATNDGFVVKVVAAAELLSSIYSDDSLLLARACYHLGNRHVELQITKKSVHYRHDHVLDEMINSVGLKVISELMPFHPEKGAYSSHHSNNGHHH
ncbi:MAG TPA: urease accessory protein UreE [Candidatus Thioglobus sp.]|jgi:urease accessory protein|nr:urease accessory protein UreE [Candidatus Thioglobus sp.]HIL42702.1 urease accessory protein UreE [Gammaproteobacteria bacterium]